MQQSRPHDYDELGHILWQFGIDTHVSEVNGICCGLLCSGQILPMSSVAALLVCESTQAKPALENTLAQEFAGLYSQLKDGQLEFRILLPDDDVVLAERIEALGAWCRGFVLAGEQYRNQEHEWSENSLELWQDIQEISLVDTSKENDDEADRNYMEIEEFLKVAVQYLFEEADSLTGADEEPQRH